MQTFIIVTKFAYLFNLKLNYLEWRMWKDIYHTSGSFSKKILFLMKKKYLFLWLFFPSLDKVKRLMEESKIINWKNKRGKKDVWEESSNEGWEVIYCSSANELLRNEINMSNEIMAFFVIN
jgi:hypothetical protein